MSGKLSASELDVLRRRACLFGATFGPTDVTLLLRHSAALEAELREMRAALEWCVAVIDNEVKPPRSCGACGTPISQCDGECMDAVYHYDGMKRARAVLAKGTKGEGEG